MKKWPRRLMYVLAAAPLLAVAFFWARSYLPEEMFVFSRQGKLMVVFAEGGRAQLFVGSPEKALDIDAQMTNARLAARKQFAKMGVEFMSGPQPVPARTTRTVAVSALTGMPGGVGAPAQGGMMGGGTRTMATNTALRNATLVRGEYRVAAISYFYPFISISLLSLLLCYRIYRRSRRFKAGQCQMCGYDLRATPGRCPECGTTPAVNAAVESTSPVL